MLSNTVLHDVLLQVVKTLAALMHLHIRMGFPQHACSAVTVWVFGLRK